MFERFTERARRVLFFARYEASQLGSISIEVDHLLLGLTREGKGATSQLFARHGIDLDEVRRTIERRSGFREKVSTSVEIPFSAATKRVLSNAAAQADELGHGHIGTEHLLLAILQETKEAGPAMLIARGLTADAARAEIRSVTESREALVSVWGDPGTYPNYVRSETVHISYSDRPAPVPVSLPSSFVALGWELNGIIASACGVPANRVQLSETLRDGRRYDIVLLPRRDLDLTQLRELIVKALEEQFDVTIERGQGPDGEFVVVTPRSDAQSSSR